MTRPAVFIRWLRPLNPGSLGGHRASAPVGLAKGSRLLDPAVLEGLLAICDASGQRPRDPIRFAQNKWGKPKFTSCGEPHFNVSHTSDIVLMAGSPDVEVGVDVEQVRHIPEAAEILGAYMHQNQVDLEAGVFMQAWCRHEARLKCLGTGLAEDPVSGPEATTTTLDLMAPSGFAAALTVRGEVAPRILTVRPMLEEAL